MRDNRGWSDDAWAGAADRLRSRGLLAGDEITESGRHLRREVEGLTDRLASEPIERALSAINQTQLLDALGPLAASIAAAATIPFPNPMGLPSLVG